MPEAQQEPTPFGEAAKIVAEANLSQSQPPRNGRGDRLQMRTVNLSAKSSFLCSVSLAGVGSRNELLGSRNEQMSQVWLPRVRQFKRPPSLNFPLVLSRILILLLVPVLVLVLVLLVRTLLHLFTMSIIQNCYS